jgi:hypothetical protein
VKAEDQNLSREAGTNIYTSHNHKCHSVILIMIFRHVFVMIESMFIIESRSPDQFMIFE